MVVVSTYFDACVILECKPDFVLLLYRCPKEPYERIFVLFHQVKVFVELLLFGQEHLVNING